MSVFIKQADKGTHKKTEIQCPNPQCCHVIGTWYFGRSQCTCQSHVWPSFCIKKNRVCKVNNIEAGCCEPSITRCCSAESNTSSCKGSFVN